MTSLSTIKGVGPKTSDQLLRAGLSTVGDLIQFLPRTYDDYSKAEAIADMKPGKVTIRARVESVKTRYIRRNMKITSAILVDDNDDKVQAVWFNQPYRERQLSAGSEFYFSGEFSLKYNKYQLTAPSCETARNLQLTTDRIMPVYPVRAGLKTTFIKKIMGQLKPLVTMLPETLPGEIIDRQSLMARSDAVREMHFPTSRAKLNQARNRLAFEELFSLILAARMNRASNQRLAGFKIEFNQAKIKSFVDSLPFELTPSQKQSAWEILQDFEKAVPMNRLLQGDVGSGKTVVAAMAAYQASLAGYQTAVMVPTEVLATQHAKTFDDLLGPMGVKVALLTGNVKGDKRQMLLNKIAQGQVDVIIGTHALFQPNVQFNSLGFVVIDEQHRFGVKQRQQLLDKTDDNHLPHLLSMTATPIPRSLQLTVFGDLDISTITQLPKGRQTVDTKIILPNSRQSMVDVIKSELAKSRQVYYVAPLIADSEISEKISAEELYKKVIKTYKGYRIGLLHGKMPSESKDKVMRDFESHQLDILVSTTVIEVGVDVTNATVIVIENADQFGLAQLHQLRGRVGRGDDKSYCYLVQSDSKPPTKRLREIERSRDGFHLAEVDLELRGAGEIYGTAQHGDINLKIANLADTKMIKLVADEVIWVTNRMLSDPTYLDNFSELGSIIKRYQRITTLN